MVRRCVTLLALMAAAAVVRGQEGIKTFDQRGAQVGEQLPDVAMRILRSDGKPYDGTLGGQVRGRPALFVTSSYTCPKSRAHFPALQALADKYADDLDVVVVYVLEAHPAGDPSPYRDGKEDVTEQNQMDNILLRQPRTLERRLEYATTFQQKFRANMPIAVDGMDNAAWKALGSGPNMAVLVDGQRKVLVRQGWFDEPAMEAEVKKLVEQRRAAKAALSAFLQEPSIDDYETAADVTVVSTLKLKERLEVDQLMLMKAPELKKLVEKYPALTEWVMGYSARGDEGGETLLQIAVEHNEIETVKMLLEHGADPEGRTGRKMPALQRAAADGDLEILRLLLPHIKHVDSRKENGPTALQQALVNGHAEAAALLVKADAQENFFTRVARGQVDEVKTFLAEDESRAGRLDGLYRSPMCYAAGAGQTDMCKLLLATGAAVNAAGRDDPPIAWAVQNRQYGTVEWLLQSGANPNVTTPLGTWVIHLAAHAGDARMMDLLLKGGAKKEAEDSIGLSTLHVAAMDGNIEVMKVLLAAGMDVNRVSGLWTGGCGPPYDYSSYYTPLLLAVSLGKRDVVSFLLSKGADISATDVRYDGVLQDALLCADPEAMVKLLLAANAPVNVENGSGKTALDTAVELKEPEMEKLLRAAGAKEGSGKQKREKEWKRK